jgi:hypothetical protein
MRTGLAGYCWAKAMEPHEANAAKAIIGKQYLRFTVISPRID